MMSMTEWTINNITLCFDAEDVEDSEKLEAALDEMGQTEEKILNLKKQENVRVSEILKSYCSMYRSFFDSVFGKGTSEKLFQGQKMKPSVHEEVYISFLDFIAKQNAQVADQSQKRFAKYKVRK